MSSSVVASSNRWHRVAPAAAVILTTLPFLGLLLQPTAITLNDDWTQILAFGAYLRDGLLEHFELPMRSHVLGSGFPIVGHPEYPVFSPLSVPVLIFGPSLGTKIAVVLVAALGAFGTWRLCSRTLDLDPWASVWAAVTLMTGSWTAAILDSGNYPQIHYLLCPLLIHLTFERRWLLGALVGATMLLDGHLNTVSCFLILGVWAVLRTPRDVLSTAIVALGSAGLSAFKLAPTIALLATEDRSIDLPYPQGIELRFAPLTDFMAIDSGVTAFGLGPVAWALALGGLMLWNAGWRLIVVLAISTLLYFGSDAPVDVFYVLSRLPILRSMDAPPKYFVFFIGMCAVLLATGALSQLAPRVRRVAVVLALLAQTPVIWTTGVRLSQIFDTPDIAQHQRPFSQVDTEFFIGGKWTGPRAQRPDLYVYYRHGAGILRWEDNFQLVAPAVPAWRVALDGTIEPNDDYSAEVWLSDGDGTAELAHISSNSMTASVRSDGATTVVFNQRYDEGWSCSGAISDRDGLLAVAAAGPGDVRCRYTSRPVMVGFAVSAATLLLFGGAFWRRRPQSGAPAP